MIWAILSNIYMLVESRKAAGQKINGKKSAEKGGTPITDKNLNFFAENAIFV